MTDQLVDDIYEAAFVPELWPTMLESLGKRVGALLNRSISMRRQH